MGPLAGCLKLDGIPLGLCDQFCHLIDNPAVKMTEAEPRLRLFETTRAYALAKLTESGELDTVTRRHAEYSVIP